MNLFYCWGEFFRYCSYLTSALIAWIYFMSSGWDMWPAVGLALVATLPVLPILTLLSVAFNFGLRGIRALFSQDFWR